MQNKIQELPTIIVKFANLVFILGIIFCILTALYASYRIFNPIYDYSLGNKGIQNFYIITILLGLLFALFFAFGLKILSNNLRVNISIVFFIVGISIYGFEAYLEFNKKTEIDIKAKYAKQLGVPFDKRTKLEVRNDLREKGIEALPNMHGYYWTEENGFTTNKGTIYPLGTVSNSITILHNQSGFYPIVEMDEYGHHNPKGLRVENNVDIVLTGDSFAEGYAVNSNENITALLRQFDFNAISLGKGGNGPLLELASLIEYAKPLKPKIVLWLYFGNDLHNLRFEMQSSILRKYLNDDNYSQDLISRQEEIDEVLMNYVRKVWKGEEERAKAENKKRERLSSNHVIKILKLYNLRTINNLIPTPTHPKSLPWDHESILPIFKDILQKSNQMISEWNGKMYFVYMPAYGRYSTDYALRKGAGIVIKNRDFVMQTANELNIPIIDVHEKVFNPHPDPLSLFPLRLNGHYTAEGYKLLVDVIKKQLEEDGYLTKN